ncbi:MAG: type II toxin-antitoxin system prevent-host-death family antitoxin [bacterium]
MTTVSLDEAKKDLEGLVKRVIADAEPIVLSSKSGQEVVMLSLDEFTSWQETFYLLANPANAAHLRKSISEARSGQVYEKELADA